MNSIIGRLEEEFADKEYAHAYMESHAISRIAAQIRAIRLQRGLSQKQLGEIAGTSQARISKLESADFESISLSTLNRLAQAFDVHLELQYVPFSHGIIDVANLSQDKLEVLSREEDLAELKCQKKKIVPHGKKFAIIGTTHSNNVTPLHGSGPAIGVKGSTLNMEWQPIDTSEPALEA